MYVWFSFPDIPRKYAWNARQTSPCECSWMFMIIGIIIYIISSILKIQVRELCKSLLDGDFDIHQEVVQLLAKRPTCRSRPDMKWEVRNQCPTLDSLWSIHVKVSVGKSAQVEKYHNIINPQPHKQKISRKTRTHSHVSKWLATYGTCVVAACVCLQNRFLNILVSKTSFLHFTKFQVYNTASLFTRATWSLQKSRNTLPQINVSLQNYR